MSISVVSSSREEVTYVLCGVSSPLCCLRLSHTCPEMWPTDQLILTDMLLYLWAQHKPLRSNEADAPSFAGCLTSTAAMSMGSWWARSRPGRSSRAAFMKERTARTRSETSTHVYFNNMESLASHVQCDDVRRKKGGYSNAFMCLQLVSSAPYLIKATHTSPRTKNVNNLQFLLEQSTVCKVTVSVSSLNPFSSYFCDSAERENCVGKHVEIPT